MAEEKETILIDLKIDKGETEKTLDSVTKKITELQQENKELLQSNKDLEKQGLKNTQAYVDNSKEIEINKNKISESNATRKSLIQSLATEDNSIKALTARNRELTKERNSLNLSTAEGQARVKQINIELDKNNKAIKENVSSLEKQKINIGNYASALDGVIPGLGGMVQGIEGSTKASLAFIATPIGAIIGALGLAIGALVAYFKGSEEGQNRFNKIMQVGGVIMEKITDIIEAVGEKIFKFLGPAFTFIGNILEKTANFIGINTEAVKGFFDEIDARAKQFASVQQRINEQERDLIVRRAQTAKEVSELIIKAQEAEGQAKLNYVNKSIALEKQLLDKELEFAKSKLEQANLNVEDDPTIENKKAQAEAVAELFNAEAAYNEGIKKLNKQRIDLEVELEQEKEYKLLELRLQRSKDVTDQYQYDLDQLKDFTDKQTSIQAGGLKYVKEFNDKINKDRANSDKAAATISKQVELSRIQEISNALGSAASLFKQHTVAYKVLASARAILNTYLGATEALKQESVLPSPFDVITKIVNVAAVIGSGLRSVAAINAVSFARGGRADNGVRWGTVGGKSHAQGGTKYYGEDGHVVELERGEGWYVGRPNVHTKFLATMSNNNVADGGHSWGTYAPTRSYALGGSVYVPQSNGIDYDRLANATARAMRSMPPPVVTVEDINIGLNRVSEITQRARVL